MAQDLPLSCACGSFRAVARDVTRSNQMHLVCYCRDCQAAPRHLGQEDRILDPQGGTALLHTQPSRFEILAGAEHLALLRLGPKGALRWYVSCCNTPIATTTTSPKFAFVGIPTANFTVPAIEKAAALGPVTLRYKIDQALSEVNEPKGNAFVFIFKTFRNILKARLSGSWRKTPFFDAECNPVRPANILTKEERHAATYP